jgi:hypothetical protein
VGVPVGTIERNTQGTLEGSESKTMVFFKITTESDIAQSFYGYPQKAGNLRYKIMKVSKKSDANKSFYIFV